MENKYMCGKKTAILSVLAVACGAGFWWLAGKSKNVPESTCPEVCQTASVSASMPAIESAAQASEPQAGSTKPARQAQAGAQAAGIPTNPAPVKIAYKKVDKSIPRLRQAATANRLYIAPESGRLVEDRFAATQEPSARGTVPYVLIPASEIDDIHHERLASMGVRELGYFPPNGMLVELTEDQFNAVAKDEMFSL
ncbi:MAG: hypothetical protein K6F50_10370, partial [Kiritimatiellae bacterium]|nr:hypothetical protein [Kiritimatiellia bacterium]